MNSSFPQDTEELKKLYQKKHQNLISNFPKNNDPQKIYEKIIELGKALPKPKENIEQDIFLVDGCQSIAYLRSELKEDNTLFYEIHSEALISAGLAALLFFIYQNEPPELILFHPPLFIQELGLNKSLSPGRSNGLASMYSKMKKDAINLILKNSK